MTLQLYNTLSRTREVFEPVDPGHVRMYVCGPTVYDYAHIGNARPVVVFDVLYRLLKALYPRVTYVRNITDVDDKIIAAAEQSGDDIAAVTTRYSDAFHADMAALGALAPDAEPRATDHIPQMIAMMQRLIEAGHGYEADGHVLFSVPSWAGYGKLSRHNQDELIAGARVEVAPYKKNPTDFVLWKPSAADQPGWDSPWGRGRPGWHLECSAMSETHLGDTFDIHGGGQDLIFPHHENEIAQSTCAHGGAAFVGYWMHNGYVTVEGEKMSKSAGNFFTVRQLLDEGWAGETIRLALLSTHYRKPLDFTRNALSEAKSSLQRFYRCLEIVDSAVRMAEQAEDKIGKDHVAHLREDAIGGRVPSDVLEALSDDLNTPLAISKIHVMSNLFFHSVKDVELAPIAGNMRTAGKLLGLLQQNPMEFLGIQDATGIGLDVGEIREKIMAREEARKQKDFNLADQIREELSAKGIILEDKLDGTTTWKRA